MRWDDPELCVELRMLTDVLKRGEAFGEWITAFQNDYTKCEESMTWSRTLGPTLDGRLQKLVMMVSSVDVGSIFSECVMNVFCQFRCVFLCHFRAK